MKSTERMANLINPTIPSVVTGHGIKSKAELALTIEEETGIEKLAKATEVLIDVLMQIKGGDGYVHAITNAHAAEQYYRGESP